mmetsp:Transcript_5744/g.10851  ORF Transcript_5744/g.10851 Transcript_5744/m.10851 type:complete len:224 (-) Transcript_5744:273-944(-)
MAEPINAGATERALRVLRCQALHAVYWSRLNIVPSWYWRAVRQQSTLCGRKSCESGPSRFTHLGRARGAQRVPARKHVHHGAPLLEADVARLVLQPLFVARRRAARRLHRLPEGRLEPGSQVAGTAHAAEGAVVRQQRREEERALPVLAPRRHKLGSPAVAIGHGQEGGVLSKQLPRALREALGRGEMQRGGVGAQLGDQTPARVSDSHSQQRVGRRQRATTC